MGYGRDGHNLGSVARTPPAAEPRNPTMDTMENISTIKRTRAYVGGQTIGFARDGVAKEGNVLCGTTRFRPAAVGAAADNVMTSSHMARYASRGHAYANRQHNYYEWTSAAERQTCRLLRRLDYVTRRRAPT